MDAVVAGPDQLLLQGSFRSPRLGAQVAGQERRQEQETRPQQEYAVEGSAAKHGINKVAAHKTSGHSAGEGAPVPHGCRDGDGVQQRVQRPSAERNHGNVEQSATKACQVAPSGDLGEPWKVALPCADCRRDAPPACRGHYSRTPVFDRAERTTSFARFRQPAPSHAATRGFRVALDPV
jgi:hypothetical protein